MAERMKDFADLPRDFIKEGTQVRSRFELLALWEGHGWNTFDWWLAAGQKEARSLRYDFWTWDGANCRRGDLRQAELWTVACPCVGG